VVEDRLGARASPYTRRPDLWDCAAMPGADPIALGADGTIVEERNTRNTAQYALHGGRASNLVESGAG
jgi:hypothetical protein